MGRYVITVSGVSVATSTSGYTTTKDYTIDVSGQHQISVMQSDATGAYTNTARMMAPGLNPGQLYFPQSIARSPASTYLIQSTGSALLGSRRKMMAPPSVSSGSWDLSSVAEDVVNIYGPTFNRITDEFYCTFAFDIASALSAASFPAWFSAQTIRWLTAGPGGGDGSSPRLLSDAAPTDTRATSWPWRFPWTDDRVSFGPDGNKLFPLLYPGQFDYFMATDGAVYTPPWLNLTSGNDKAWGNLWWGPSSIAAQFDIYQTVFDSTPGTPEPGSFTATCYGLKRTGAATSIQSWTTVVPVISHDGGWNRSACSVSTTLTLTNPVPADVIQLYWDWSAPYTTDYYNFLVPYVPGVPISASSDHITGDRMPTAWLMKLRNAL